MNIKYIVPRFIRRFLPEKLVRFLLLHDWIIHPGLETQKPEKAAERALRDLEKVGVTLQGKRVMVFGYGGRFAFGVALLRLGASHVVLCDKFAPPDEDNNRKLLPAYQDYLEERGGRVFPRPEWITLVEDDIRAVASRDGIPPVDIVVSSSVYEHLDDVDGITAALASLTTLGGTHLHYIDLRDHYFKYPFEMLCYSEKIWYGWLNPSSNHNRFRVWDYRRVFEKYFSEVDLTVIARDKENFEKAKARIRPEFLSGNPEDDSVTVIKVVARC